MRKATAILLVLSAINLTMMILGGVAETRSVPTYPLSVLIGFNLFLAILGLGSLLLATRIYRHGRGVALARVAGFSYLAVYLLDLAVIFPISTTPMSATLQTLEGVGVLLGIALVIAALRSKESVGGAAHPLSKPMILVGAALIIGIVIFATFFAI